MPSMRASSISLCESWKRCTTSRMYASTASGGARPLAIEEYIREVIERFQDSHSETELARMLGIGRKALWMRRRQWGLKRTRKDVSR